MPQKYHDPMKTVTERPNGGEERTRKEKRTNRMDFLGKQLMQLNVQMCEESNGESDTEIERILKEFVNTCKPFFAEIHADFLIANNIARRGKPLHPDTALKKLAKMRGSMMAKTVEWDINSSVVVDLSSSESIEHNLYYFLRIKYGVTLMGTNTYNYCMKKIKECQKERQLKHWQNFAKKFHATVINKTTQETK